MYNIPTVSVMKRHGKWVTADNRRLWVFRQLERLGKCETISVRITNYIPEGKLTSYNGGESVVVRGSPGGYWHNRPTPSSRKSTPGTALKSQPSQTTSPFISASARSVVIPVATKPQISFSTAPLFAMKHNSHTEKNNPPKLVRHVSPDLKRPSCTVSIHSESSKFTNSKHESGQQIYQIDKEEIRSGKSRSTKSSTSSDNDSRSSPYTQASREPKFDDIGAIPAMNSPRKMSIKDNKCCIIL